MPSPMFCQRGSNANFDVIDFAFANVLARGFITNFGVIYYAFANILMRVFASDFGIIVKSFINIQPGDSPSTLASLTMSLPMF